MAIAVFVHLTC